MIFLVHTIEIVTDNCEASGTGFVDHLLYEQSSSYLSLPTHSICQWHMQLLLVSLIICILWWKILKGGIKKPAPSHISLRDSRFQQDLIKKHIGGLHNSFYLPSLFPLLHYWHLLSVPVIIWFCFSNSGNALFSLRGDDWTILFIF